MAKRPWDGIVPEEELAIYKKAGFGGSSGLGKRPALLIIDMQYRSMGESPKPILQAMDEYGPSCGEYGWRAVPNVAKLIAAICSTKTTQILRRMPERRRMGRWPIGGVSRA